MSVAIANVNIEGFSSWVEAIKPNLLFTPALYLILVIWSWLSLLVINAISRFGYFDFFLVLTATKTEKLDRYISQIY
ncbi:MAG TPA: hypothetical protein DEG17_23165 [Cyanobacteria bacterium UBA11149]|nr:hypothetical protein [Cyanobacteria bacterium UBA11367]HBE60228.1 hypothetical protein [Cyanobacteria bacterium UBA11366]HBK66478.1 hypothetical protein [Cyanobacteria bacterium UBA11166]HBR73095.1 hypothetical protein [Cyanobacteria bacterium UBA11159]HBS70469.1 hypothetical protein [Cyanobacteria bacterium UBA11153]HBW91682.1 hypothetical protein [Cyanobacteria bacterium UBA11149]HCA96588.1 hypothetical protein [Cyanobacteria bacterium UBA9226]